MSPPFPVPSDVRLYIDSVFRRVNRRVSTALTNTPNIHEEALDFMVISALAEFSAPHRLPSNYLVDMDVHFLGGGRHFDAKWEIADIGVIVIYRRGENVVRTKIALLQSKRLYPREVDFVEAEPIAKPGGYGWLSLPTAFPAQHERTFTFDASCRYSALQVGDGQWQRIAEYEKRHNIPVHYLLYHPLQIPFNQIVPLTADRRHDDQIDPDVGARVVRAEMLRECTSQLPRNYAPSLDEIRNCTANVAQFVDELGWSLNHFMSEEVVDCREGYIADDAEADAGLFAVFNQRGAPISAAFRVTVEAPAEVGNP